MPRPKELQLGTKTKQKSMANFNQGMLEAVAAAKRRMEAILEELRQPPACYKC